MIAIDLGSNTIRLIEFDGCQWGKSFEKIVKTAESLHQSGQIGASAVQRIIDAIDEAKGVIDFSSGEIVAYTTAAMRLATNSQEVLETIYEKSGVRFNVIDAQTEGRLTLNAVLYRLKMLGNSFDPFVLCDIGGGSTELIRYAQGEIETLSIDQGIVTLSESAYDKDGVFVKIDEFKASIARQMGESSYGSLVMTAGTPTTIVAYLLGMDYLTYDPTKINGYRLSLNDCICVYDQLLSMDESERTRFVGVGRENLIIAGILMVIAVYEVMGVEEAIVVDDGLREGIALEYYKMK
ncbi:phosphatase [Sulfuricurvum sp.]|uniref:Ppx/GppA phosphatase family protein n=1 Tax=Sulfuricurvum sp. TaxID=2025608 RepID=UPI0019BB726A|nr:phosphatase [Sulfuricurvum sp.]MBD3798616.1 phosphatase [Campylobacterota bacterium]MBD3805711.1 phosphatase [Sulfuricurvum sp.]